MCTPLAQHPTRQLSLPGDGNEAFVYGVVLGGDPVYDDGEYGVASVEHCGRTMERGWQAEPKWRHHPSDLDFTYGPYHGPGTPPNPLRIRST
jgi:hypothetical protein